MSVTNASLPWSTDDVLLWRNFLDSEVGRRLIPKLAESAPILLDGADVNKTLVRNGELRGYQDAIRTLLALSEVTPEVAPSADAYPPLDDDSRWPSN